MDYSSTSQTTNIVLMLFCATLVYIIIDLWLKGLLWYIFNHWVLPWWENLFQIYDYNQLDAMAQPAKRKDDKVVYRSGGVYTSQKFNDVWVESYVDAKDPGRGFVTEKKPYFNGAVVGYEWCWLANKSSFGWREKEPPKPPPKPSIIVSEGIKDQVENFLNNYRANEINKRLTKMPQKETKTNNPIEKEPIQQQNLQT